jgi:hypothetical protein
MMPTFTLTGLDRSVFLPSKDEASNDQQSLDALHHRITAEHPQNKDQSSIHVLCANTQALPCYPQGDQNDKDYKHNINAITRLRGLSIDDDDVSNGELPINQGQQSALAQMKAFGPKAINTKEVNFSQDASVIFKPYIELFKEPLAQWAAAQAPAHQAEAGAEQPGLSDMAVLYFLNQFLGQAGAKCISPIGAEQYRSFLQDHALAIPDDHDPEYMTMGITSAPTAETKTKLLQPTFSKDDGLNITQILPLSYTIRAPGHPNKTVQVDIELSYALANNHTSLKINYHVILKPETPNKPSFLEKKFRTLIEANMSKRFENLANNEGALPDATLMDSQQSSGTEFLNDWAFYGHIKKTARTSGLAATLLAIVLTLALHASFFAIFLPVEAAIALASACFIIYKTKNFLGEGNHDLQQNITAQANPVEVYPESAIAIALQIQKIMRAKKPRSNFQAFRSSTKRIQKVMRGWQGRRKAAQKNRRRQHTAATLLQNIFRRKIPALVLKNKAKNQSIQATVDSWLNRGAQQVCQHAVHPAAVGPALRSCAAPLPATSFAHPEAHRDLDSTTPSASSDDDRHSTDGSTGQESGSERSLSFELDRDANPEGFSAVATFEK